MTKTSSENKRSDDEGGNEPHIVSLRLDSVQIGDRRECNDEALNDLAVSMRDIGQINPIKSRRTRTRSKKTTCCWRNCTAARRPRKLTRWR